MPSQTKNCDFVQHLLWIVVLLSKSRCYCSDQVLYCDEVFWGGDLVKHQMWWSELQRILDGHITHSEVCVCHWDWGPMSSGSSPRETSSSDHTWFVIGMRRVWGWLVVSIVLGLVLMVGPMAAGSGTKIWAAGVNVMLSMGSLRIKVVGSDVKAWAAGSVVMLPSRSSGITTGLWLGGTYPLYLG